MSTGLPCDFKTTKWLLVAMQHLDDNCGQGILGTYWGVRKRGKAEIVMGWLPEADLYWSASPLHGTIQIRWPWVSLQLGRPQRLLMGNEMPSQSQAEAVLGSFSLLLKPSDLALL